MLSCDALAKKAENISLPALFSDIPVIRRSRRKVPNTVTHPTAQTTKTADIGANTDRSSVTQAVHPARQGRPRKVVAQCVVAESVDPATIVPRCRCVKHNVNTEAICDLGSQRSIEVDSASLLDTLNMDVHDSQELSAVLHANDVPSDNFIPFVKENVESPVLKENFPKLTALSTINSSNITIKTHKDMPSQSIINKLLDLMNHKINYFYHLPFELTTLRKEQRKDHFFSSIIDYLESNHLPSNIKRQQSIISEAENFIMFNNILCQIVDRTTGTIDNKIALCIPLQLSDNFF